MVFTDLTEVRQLVFEKSKSRKSVPWFAFYKNIAERNFLHLFKQQSCLTFNLSKTDMFMGVKKTPNPKQTNQQKKNKKRQQKKQPKTNQKKKTQPTPRKTPKTKTKQTKKQIF